MKNALLSVCSLTILFFGLASVQSCNDDPDITGIENELETETESGTGAENIANFNLYLTDCPFDAQEVNVEILKIIVQDKSGNEEELTTNAGIYNLLEFTDGIDTLLAYGTISLEDIKDIYFELGDQNTIMVDGEIHDLELIGNTNIVRVKVNLDDIDDEDYLVDFYACTSIVSNNNGYFIKPVIKFKGNRGGQGQGDDIEDLFEDLEECYMLIYPISVLDTAGTSFSANDREELIDILIENEIANLVYPISVNNSEGGIIVINSLEEIEELEDDCEEDEDDDNEESEEFEELIENIEECFRLEYPLDLIDFNGNIYNVSDDQELENAIDDYQIVDFSYPISVSDANGVSFVLNSLEEAEELDNDCDEDEEEEEAEEFEELVEDIAECFDFEYPLDLLDVEGNVYTAQNDNQFGNTLEDQLIVNFSYPISVSDAEGETFVINSLEEAEDLEDDCDEEEEEEEEEFEELVEEIEECYRFQYPLELIDENGSSYLVGDEDQLEEAIEDNDAIDFIYPIILIDENNATIQIEGASDIDTLDLDC